MTNASLPAAPRRELGQSDEKLSALTFGSMRMLERALGVADWRQLLTAAHARGVTTWHSSDEYESFPCLCEVWLGLEPTLRGKVEHIVKLAEPHFGHDHFDAARIRQRVDQYRQALRVDRIDVIQWMWRGDLKDEPTRLERLAQQLPEIAETYAALRQEGKIGAVATFPYTLGCAELLLGQDWNQGFTLYVNSLETEMLPFMERAAASGASTIALRPLAAGKMAEGELVPASALAWALEKPGVSTGVVSFSSYQHLDQLLGAFAR